MFRNVCEKELPRTIICERVEAAAKSFWKNKSKIGTNTPPPPAPPAEAVMQTRNSKMKPQISSPSSIDYPLIRELFCRKEKIDALLFFSKERAGQNKERFGDTVTLNWEKDQNKKQKI